MKGKYVTLAWLSFVVLLAACKNDLTSKTLPRSTPEAEGVSSQGILDFLEAAEFSQHEFHSFMFLRHGKVIAEGWWDPYKPDMKHTLYSTSKSFTAAAIGFAVSEKRLSVNDKVISFFPGDLPDTLSSLLADMSVKDLLTMTTGQEPDPTFTTVARDSNWVKAFLSLPVKYDPGTVFLYNSLATYMLSAIVQQVTGQKMIDYLTPRLFLPLGIEGMDWETDPRGINTGGWGLRLKTEDMAKFGQLYLQKGKWHGRQILPADWIKEATTPWIDQAPNASQTRRDSSDWVQGYCYQMWRGRHNTYRADGAYGQYIIVIPDQDAVVAITCESPDMQDEINLVWEYLLPAMHNVKLSEDTSLANKLNQRLASLCLEMPEGDDFPEAASRVNGKEFVFQPNDQHLQSILLNFGDKMCKLTLKTDEAVHDINFGFGQWIKGETHRVGPNLVQHARGHFSGLLPAKIAGSFSWKDENKLVLVMRYIESPHRETLTCSFKGSAIQVSIQTSQRAGIDAVPVNGKMME